MSQWNFADLWETVADCLPELPAIVQGDRRLTWGEMDRRANGLARAILKLGLGRQDKVALYLTNCPEYLEATFAILKAGLVPVNTNYRYRGDELRYLWDDSDTAAVIFHGSFTGQIEEIRTTLPAIKGWIWVDDGSGSCPAWATSYETAAAAGDSRVAASWGRSPDDLILLYTGGTTGMPKGVMWRQEDTFLFLNATSPFPYPADATLDDVRSILAQRGRGHVHLPPSPLMHATGGWSSMTALSAGGTVVLLTGRSFSAVEMLDAIDREGVQVTIFVGEAFARPLLDALETSPGRWSLASLLRVTSTGSALAPATRKGLRAQLPDKVVFSEGLSSSEAVSMGRSVVSADNDTPGKFQLAAGVRVISEDGRDVVPGLGEPGMLAYHAILPLGYYKDPAKTAKTFREFDGRRYVVPGDYATVEPDGTITFVGRGNLSINTGGEKVFPQEVEEVLLAHPAVDACGVTGVPDARFVEAVTAVVTLRPGSEMQATDLIDHVKRHLAGYKAPRHVFVVDSVPRLPTGKIDYPALRRLATDLAAG